MKKDFLDTSMMWDLTKAILAFIGAFFYTNMQVHCEVDMKKILRIILIILIAFLSVTAILATANMILNREETNNIVFFTGTYIILIGMCIAFFVLLGKKKKD